MEAWSVPLRDDRGAVTAIITTFQDISHRRAIEQELAGYRDQFEARVAQRTAAGLRQRQPGRARSQAIGHQRYQPPYGAHHRSRYQHCRKKVVKILVNSTTSLMPASACWMPNGARSGWWRWRSAGMAGCLPIWGVRCPTCPASRQTTCARDRWLLRSWITCLTCQRRYRRGPSCAPWAWRRCSSRRCWPTTKS